ncbi:MAG TPA: M1 family metallopeptidase [Thermoanaerobacterales bacterium]|nr:M1 family metallopeptidase [Thermoanaerobacterales bacterium]
MKKVIAAFGVLLLAMLVFFFVFALQQMPSQNNHSSASGRETEKEPQRNIYNINLEYDGLNHIKAEMDFTYVNNAGKSMSELYFHLYPNIFRDRNHLPFSRSDQTLVFPDGFSTGGIDITQALQDGSPVEWTTVNGDEILKLALKKPVEAGKSSKIHFKFSLTVPKANYRFGYRVFGKDRITLSLGNWYPLLVKYDNGKWSLDKHPAMGDPTYSDISDYTVSFTVPQDFTVAASGVMNKKTISHGKAIYVYSMENIRDFAAAISNNYKTAEDFVDGIKIISYFHPEDRKGGFMALDVVKHALSIYNASFGKYPYPELRVAEANFYAGGMEFPTFIMMNTGRYRESNLSSTSFERSMAHEVAHQWWYCLVGNDQINEPWLDEGLAEFSTLYYFEKRYRSAGKESYFTRYVNTNTNLIKQSKRKMQDPVKLFRDNREYFAIVYVKGALFYEELKNTIGEEKLLDFLRTYLNTYKYKNVSLNEFIDLLKQRNYDGVNQDFFKKWF